MHVPIIEDFDNFKRYFQKLKHLYCQMEGLNAVHWTKPAALEVHSLSLLLFTVPE